MNNTRNSEILRNASALFSAHLVARFLSLILTVFILPQKPNIITETDIGCYFLAVFIASLVASVTELGMQAPLIRVPWLLVHGTADDVVPLEDSREIFDLANQPKKLIEIPEADHVFSEQALVPMCEAVISWLGDTLRP